MQYRPFSTWQVLLTHVRNGAKTYYKAPFDFGDPRRITAAVISAKARKVKVSPFGHYPRGQRPFDPFMADEGHLGRFFWALP